MGRPPRQQGRHHDRPRGSPHASGERLRSELAQLAARFLADGEAEDLGDAKRRAAERLGVRDTRDLPDNLAVVGAIVEYQRIFEPDHAPERLVRLRAIALRAMRALGEFEPRLVGPVLYGTAFDHTPIALHLHSDEVEAVVRRLLALRASYTLEERALRSGRHATERVPMLVTALEDVELELLVLPRQRLANPPRSPLDGGTYRRLDAAGLERLLDSADAGEPLPEIAALAPRAW